MESVLFVLTFRRWYVMRKSRPEGVSIIHIFFRDGMIYFAVIFGTLSLLLLLVCEPTPGVLVLTSSHWQPWLLGPWLHTSALP
jgi:hypothetical protein